MAYKAIKERLHNHVVNLRLKALWARQAESATITVGDEDTNVVNVAVQLTDASGTSVAAQQVVRVFVSDSATGAGVAATAPSGGAEIGTDGIILQEETADKIYTVETESDGSFDIDVTEAGTDAFYVVVVMPNGKTVVSSALSFTA